MRLADLESATVSRAATLRNGGRDVNSALVRVRSLGSDAYLVGAHCDDVWRAQRALAIVFGVEVRNSRALPRKQITNTRLDLPFSRRKQQNREVYDGFHPLPAAPLAQTAGLTVWSSHDGVSPGVAAQQPGQGLAGWREQPWVVGRSAVAGCRQAPVDGPGRRQAVSGPIDGWQVMPLLRGYSPLRCARPGSGYRGAEIGRAHV